MSNIPLLFSQGEPGGLRRRSPRRATAGARVAAATRFRPRHFKPEIGLQMGLTDPVCGLNMGETAEVLAKEHGISREEQDAFALRSHQRVDAARARLAEEIVPVPDPAELPRRWRRRTTASARTRRWRRSRSSSRTSTAGSAPSRPGNSSQITDGGAAVAPHERAGGARARATRRSGRSAASPSRRSSRSAWGSGPPWPSRWRSSGPASRGRTSASSRSTRRSRRRCSPTRASSRRRPGTRSTGPTGPIGEIDWEKTNVNGGAIALGPPGRLLGEPRS